MTLTLRRLAVLLLLACASEATADPVLVLPLVQEGQGGQGKLDRQAARLFDARLLVALGPGGVTLRGDEPGAQELTGCVTPACLLRLGQLSGASRVLSLSLLGDDGHYAVFVQLFDAASGRAVARREFAKLSRDDLAGRAPDEIAAWLASDQGENGRGVRLALSATGGGEARELVDALSEKLPAAFPAFEIDGARPTHELILDPVELHLGTRVHHVHDYVDGELDATLTIRDASDGTIKLTRRAHATFSRRANRTTLAEARTALVDDVVGQWIAALHAKGVEALLQPRRKP